jgi:hypothetical protein
MTQLTLDPAILGRLASLKGTVQLCYPDGRVAGQFVPGAADPPHWHRPPVSDEELAQRKQEGGRSLAEILADLEKRA